MVDSEWDVILIGAGQNNFALGTYLGMAGLKTVICESRLENGGRLASEEITQPGYWHNTLGLFSGQPRSFAGLEGAQMGRTATTLSSFRRRVISALLLADGQSIAHHQSIEQTVSDRSNGSRPKTLPPGVNIHGRFHQADPRVSDSVLL